MPDPSSSATAGRRMAGPPVPPSGTGTGLAEAEAEAEAVTTSPPWLQYPDVSNGSPGSHGLLKIVVPPWALADPVSQLLST